MKLRCAVQPRRRQVQLQAQRNSQQRKPPSRARDRQNRVTREAERVLDQLTIPSETIRLPEIAPYMSSSVQEPGIDGLARTNLRFS
jgi:hypothetical protein